MVVFCLLASSFSLSCVDSVRYVFILLLALISGALSGAAMAAPVRVGATVLQRIGLEGDSRFQSPALQRSHGRQRER
jgi:hypothetical protein